MSLNPPRPLVKLEDCQQNWDWLKRLFPLDLSNRSLVKKGTVSGAATLTWPGAVATATVTVTHGLSTTPTAVLITADDSATGRLTNCSVGTIGATTFVARGNTIDASNPALNTTTTLYWIAIG